MGHHQMNHPDYGTGQKKLGMYLVGFIMCSLLTLISFWAVLSQHFAKQETLAIILSSAVIQFLVQVFFFLRVSTKTKQGKANVMTLVFTGVVLTTMIVGSLWIMYNLNYFMMH